MANIIRYNKLRVGFNWRIPNPPGLPEYTGSVYATFPHVYGKYSRVTIDVGSFIWAKTNRPSSDDPGWLMMGPNYASSSINPSLRYTFRTDTESFLYTPAAFYEYEGLNYVGFYTKANGDTNGRGNTIQTFRAGKPPVPDFPYPEWSRTLCTMDQYDNGNFHTNWTLVTDTSTYTLSSDIYSDSQNSNDYSNPSLYPELHYIDSSGGPYIDDLYVCHVPVSSFNQYMLSNGYFMLYFQPYGSLLDTVDFYSLKFEEFNTSTNSYEVIEEYQPCTCDGSTGFINSLNNIFVPMEGFTSFDIDEDEFHELFPNADIYNLNNEFYTGGVGPFQAFKAVGTLTALQSLISTGNVYIGQLISVVNNSQNNGLYHIVLENGSYTYKKLSFAQ